MATILLANLDPCLLEKIITKLDFNSYIRVQQTCHWMNEFVRRSKNISVYLFGTYALKSSGKDSQPCLQRFSGMDAKMNIEWTEMEEHCGLRVRELIAYDCNFDEACDYLKKSHITCKVLSMNRATWTKDECTAIFKIVKPVSVLLNSYSGSDRFQALFQSSLLSRASVIADPVDAVSVTSRLISAFPEVAVQVGCGDTLASDYKLIHTVLKLLCTQPIAHLRKFQFSLRAEEPYCCHQLMEGLDELNLAVREEWNKHETIFVRVEMPNGYSCKIAIPEHSDLLSVIYYGVDSDTSSLYSYVGDDDSDDDLDDDF